MMITIVLNLTPPHPQFDPPLHISPITVPKKELTAVHIIV